MAIFADPHSRWWAIFFLRLFGSLLIGVLAVLGIMASARSTAAEPRHDTPAVLESAGTPNQD